MAASVWCSYRRCSRSSPSRRAGSRPKWAASRGWCIPPPADPDGVSLLTNDAVSQSVSARRASGHAGCLFLVVYAFLMVAWARVVGRFIKEGPVAKAAVATAGAEGVSRRVGCNGRTGAAGRCRRGQGGACRGHAGRHRDRRRACVPRRRRRGCRRRRPHRREGR